MNSAEILDGILNSESAWSTSPSVGRSVGLFTEMYDALCETLTSEQCEFLTDIDYIGSVLQKDIFKDGVIYGMKISRDINRLIENPELAYGELRETKRCSHEAYARGTEAKKNFEKSVIEMKTVTTENA